MTDYFALILVGAVFLYAVSAKRLSGGLLTGPMIFLFLGLGFAQFSAFDELPLSQVLGFFAELTLVVVLFADGAQLNVAKLKAGWAWSFRLLLIGLPLSIVFGSIAGLGILNGWNVWEIALLAALMAPTDAALVQAIVQNSMVPDKIREALSVESGLNDGVALPITLFLACLAVGGQHDFVQTSWLWFAIEQIGYGALVGAVLGYLGSKVLTLFAKRGFCDATSTGVATLALAALTFLAADWADGNGLIAAFVAGIAFGTPKHDGGPAVCDFLENEGQLLSILSFFLIGSLLVSDGLSVITPAYLALILICLCIVRPLAVWLALCGTKTTTQTRLYLGWFGPRGLATALFAVILGEIVTLEHGKDILAITSVTVLLSAVLHGLSAGPATRRWADKLTAP